MSFDALLIDRCDIVRRSHDRWGAVVVEAVDLDVRCRWVYKSKLVRDFHGEEVMSYAQVFFAPTVALGPNDQLRYEGREWSPVRIHRPADSSRRHHVEVYVA